MSSPSTARQPGMIVYFCGLATTLLTLWLLQVLKHNDTNVLGWYANGVIPIGALFAGLASGSGYAVGSRVLNARLTRGYVWGMLITGLLDWFAAAWMDYSEVLAANHLSFAQYSFIEYFRMTAESMAFTSSDSSSPGAPLGAFGYFFKALEIAGFAGGSMIPVAILLKQPYCRSCQYYLAKTMRRVIPSTATAKEIQKTPRKERKAAVAASVQQMLDVTASVRDSLQNTSYTETVDVLTPLLASQKGAAAHAVITLKKCPRCDTHHLSWSIVHINAQGKRAVSTLPAQDKPAAAAA